VYLLVYKTDLARLYLLQLLQRHLWTLYLVIVDDDDVFKAIHVAIHAVINDW